MTGRIPIQTLAIGALGALLAWAAHVPAPFLLGPAASVTLLALAGGTVAIPGRLRDIGFVAVGSASAAGVTPEVVTAAARWPLSLVLLVAVLAGILWGGGAMLRTVFGLDRTTAILASAPGHLSYVLGLGLETKADLPLLTLIQSLRVLALTLLTPPLVMLLSGAPLPRGLPPVAGMGLGMLAALAAAAALVGMALQRLRVPAALLIAAMLVSALGHGSGLTPGGVPPWLSVPGFVLMGSLIGTRFSGVSLTMLRRAFGAAMLLTLLAVVMTSLAAFLASWMFGFPLTAALIAFAPGGVETMAAMALLLHADPAYVALHHVVRLFALTFLIPMVLGRRD